MCGIVVGLTFGKLSQRDEAMRQKLLRYFTTELMLVTEDRGKDATGAAILFNDGKYMGIKRGARSSEFLSLFGETPECYGSLLKVWRDHDERVRVYLGHCRAGTSGDKEDNENNHPIKIGNLVGIHNGVIKNHNIIFKKLGCKRDGEVDSESIFRLFDHYTKSGKEPFTIDMLQEVVNRLDGQFAVTMFNADNLDQIPIFRDGRPVEFVLLRKYGILLMVSEIKFWDRIHFRYERMANYYNDMHSNKIPSFLDKGDVVTTKMLDDTGMIFDLSKKVTEDTKIEDLCESKKMSRNDKIWKTSFTYNGGTNYKSSGTGSVKSAADKAADDAKKCRVFNKITKMYVTRVGDKVLDNAKPTTISVDKKEEDKEKDKVKDKPITALTKTIADAKKDGFKKDNKEEKESSAKVNLKDTTTYNAKKEVAKKSKDDVIIDVDPKDIKVVDKTGDITEVQMVTYSPEVMEAANKAYETLPIKQKGCDDLEDLLDIIDIKDKRTAEILGMPLIGNRAMKHGWLQGYMHALHTLPISDKVADKPSKREHHIAGLKSLVMLLIKFYEASEGANSGKAFQDFASNRLAQVTFDNDKHIDIDGLSRLFNSHEKELLKGPGEIIAQASYMTKPEDDA